MRCRFGFGKHELELRKDFFTVEEGYEGDVWGCGAVFNENCIFDIYFI